MLWVYIQINYQYEIKSFLGKPGRENNSKNKLFPFSAFNP
jgi:hypothetical protein